MNRLLSGTLVLALAPLVSAAPQAPASPGGETRPGQTAQKHTEKKKEKPKRHHGEEKSPAGNTTVKPGATGNSSGKPKR